MCDSFIVIPPKSESGNKYYWILPAGVLFLYASNALRFGIDIRIANALATIQRYESTRYYIGFDLLKALS